MKMSKRAMRVLVACALALAATVWVSAAVAGEKRGGTLTIVRPTDPVSLDSNLETTGPGAWVYYNIGAAPGTGRTGSSPRGWRPAGSSSLRPVRFKL
jgi:hypothetical protein